MATFDDMALEGKITVYDKGFDEQHELVRRVHHPRRATSGARGSRTSSRCGPRCEHFVRSIREGTAPISDGAAGLRVVRVLEALQQSLDATRREGLARTVALTGI